MKRFLLILVVAVVFALPAFAEFRADIGVDIPRGIGGVVDNNADISKEAVDFFNEYIFPIPEGGLYYQHPFGPVRIGVGARIYTFILESIFWPNAFVEADLWKFTFELQTGGALFGMFGLYNNIEFGKVFIPDLSAWFRIGKTFRIGAGATGLMIPEMTDDLVFVYYLGAKFALTF
ncbi:hypothetical protein MASR2M78_36390 [Treponema sp.]